MCYFLPLLPLLDRDNHSGLFSRGIIDVLDLHTVDIPIDCTNIYVEYYNASPHGTGGSTLKPLHSGLRPTTQARGNSSEKRNQEYFLDLCEEAFFLYHAIVSLSPDRTVYSGAYPNAFFAEEISAWES